MRILVTGTAGFIGYHVAQSLLADGHEVVGIDNFNAYYPVVLKEARHRLLEGKPGYLGVRMDLGDDKALLELVRAEKIDGVCHLAAQAGVRHSLKHPFDYSRANLHGTLAILEAVRHAGISRCVYASSSSVYGGNTKLPFSEDDPVDRPVSLYAATKRANELMAHTYTHLYGFQTVGLRFFTVYGPWGRPDMAMWLFSEAILHDQPIAVFNHGDMQRDFTYIDDIVAGVKAALFADKLDPFEIFNLGNNNAEALMTLIRTLADKLGAEPRMDLKPMQPGDVQSTYADITRAQKKLGFAPCTRLAEGVGNFVDWFRAHEELTEAVWRTRTP